MTDPCADPIHPGNSPKHLTGKLCIEKCGRPAGTAWSPYWCQPCNAERIRRVNAGLAAAMAQFDRATPKPAQE